MPVPPLPPLLDAIAARDLAIAGDHEQALLAEINRANAERLRADNLQFANTVIEAHAKHLAAELAAEKANGGDPAGVVNAREYGAAGDGKADDTNAIQRAVYAAASKPFGPNRPGTVYLPPGEYLVSDTIRWDNDADPAQWRAYVVLQGAGRDRTMIRLKDGAPGFGDPASAKAVLMTASQPQAGVSPAGQAEGKGNAAFSNGVYDLCVDCAEGNPRAVGIDWLGSNDNALRRLAFRGSGQAAVKATRPWPGPGVIADLSVEGLFEHSLIAAAIDYGITAERILSTAPYRNAGVMFLADATGEVVEVAPLAVSWRPSGLIAPRPTPFIPALSIDRTFGKGERWHVTDSPLILDRANSPGQMDALPGNEPRILHTGPAPVIIRDCQMGAGLVYEAREGAGPVFISCAYSVNGVWKFAPGQHVYARSFNAEKAKTADAPPFTVVSRGARLWLFGAKFEGAEGFINAEGGTLDFAGVDKRNVPAGPLPTFQLRGGCRASIRCVFVTDKADKLPAIPIDREGPAAGWTMPRLSSRKRGAGLVAEWSSE